MWTMPARHTKGRTQPRRTSLTAPSTLAALAALLAIARLPRADAAYKPLKTYAGSNFFDAWDFYGAWSLLDGGSAFASGSGMWDSLG